MSPGERTTRAEERGLEVRDLAGQAGLDAVGVALARSSVQVPSPASSSPAASPFGRARQLLELDPQDRRALGSARGIDRGRLTADDRRLGGEQAALGLVDGAGDAVEPGRHVDDRRPRETLVAVPARRLGAPCGSACRPGRTGSGGRARRVAREPASREQALVELRRRHVGDHRLGGLDRLACRRADAASPALAHDDPLDVAPGLERAARVADDAGERLDELTPPPRGTGIPPSSIATAITCVMNPDEAAPGRARCAAPRARAAHAPAARRTSRSPSRGRSRARRP